MDGSKRREDRFEKYDLMGHGVFECLYAAQRYEKEPRR